MPVCQAQCDVCEMRVSVGLKCKASTDNFLPFSVERERGRASSLGLGKGITRKHRGSATDRGHSLGDPLMGHHDRLWPCAGSQYWPTARAWPSCYHVCLPGSSAIYVLWGYLGRPSGHPTPTFTHPRGRANDPTSHFTNCLGRQRPHRPAWACAGGISGFRVLP